MAALEDRHQLTSPSKILDSLSYAVPCVGKLFPQPGKSLPPSRFLLGAPPLPASPRGMPGGALMDVPGPDSPAASPGAPGGQNPLLMDLGGPGTPYAPDP